MWEEDIKKDDKEDSEEEEEDDDDDELDEIDGEKTIKMAEIHWCFRRSDLPGIMKNLTVEDVSYLY